MTGPLLEQPTLPVPGQLFLVDTLIFWGGDRKLRRPAVVVEIPRDDFGRIALVTRTTNMRTAGVVHRADSRLGLDKDGVFARIARVEALDWTPRMVKLLGTLDRATFEQVLEWVG